eukprot:8985022-Lingulodinium_polyedra.AAC.1
MKCIVRTGAAASWATSAFEVVDIPSVRSQSLTAIGGGEDVVHEDPHQALQVGAQEGHHSHCLPGSPSGCCAAGAAKFDTRHAHSVQGAVPQASQRGGRDDILR